jgi:predicted O-linked N-acetylglucosamine transferase (SPINDLY family)
LAPIQVGYLGYPGTTGAEYMDYLVADKTLIPEGSQRYYSEKIIYLPDTYMVDDSKRQPSSRKFSRTEQGLPEDKFVFCCFNNTYKFNHKILESWTKILLNVPESILWISEGHDLFQKNIVKEFEILGIDYSRLIFAKRVDLIGDHLSRLSLADLFLDTIPFNAHSTAVDSLKAGLPILTCMGQAFAGRVAGSLLNGVGMPELIAKDIGEYESIAINLAKNPAMLMKLRAKLAENKISAPLFNTRLFAGNLELAYQEIYSRYLSDQPLDHIYI